MVYTIEIMYHTRDRHRNMTCSNPGFYGRPVTAGGSGCTRCPEGATASPGSLVASSCYCTFGYLTAPQNSSLTSNSSLTCLLSFSSVYSLARFVDLGNPGESCSQVCAATGRSCQAKLLQGVRSQSDVQQTLTAVDVSLASAFEPSASSLEVFTGLHAHYTATSWDATAGMWHDVSGNARHGVGKYEARSAECSVRVCPSSVCVCVVCVCCHSAHAPEDIPEHFLKVLKCCVCVCTCIRLCVSECENCSDKLDYGGWVGGSVLVCVYVCEGVGVGGGFKVFT
jgi:hypothetical protein